MFDTATHRPAALPPGHRPVLAVIVDTEEEFDWTRPLSRGNRGVTAVEALEASHEAVYDRLGLKPAYVIDHPVAATPSSARILRRLQDEGRCEVGTHLHPWVNPPDAEIVTSTTSYAGNLPPELEHAKLSLLTDVIADAMGRRPTLYKAGRYGAGPNTSAILHGLGYTMDASVVPWVSFGDDGGPDYRAVPVRPYWFGPGGSLLELPLTSGFCGLLRRLGPRLHGPVTRPLGMRLHLPGILARSGLFERVRLSPEGCTLAEMQRLTRALLKDGVQVFTLTYHSPSVAVGHTPYVRSESQRTAFLATIRAYATWFRDSMGGSFATPSEIRSLMLTGAAAPAAGTAAADGRAADGGAATTTARVA
ncbi:polysaccharide deacetylase family protein [Caenispirillum bisanense]|uniref:polysaccharide deacetylase family protein n=1 Tax=Caenispirillum bisanense TaxID=414052 RepID=UPI0031D0818D